MFKKVGFVLSVLFILLASIFTVSALSKNAYAKSSAGEWYEVCCGSTCPAGDICWGDGSYKCCK